MGQKQSAPDKLNAGTVHLMIGRHNKQLEILAFSPESNQIFQLKTPKFPQGQQLGKRFGCLMLAPDQVYLIGGTVDKKATKAVFLYNPLNGEVMEIQSMMTERFDHCVTFKNNKIYVIAGLKNNELLSSCEVYHLKSQEWKPIASTKLVRSQCSSVIYDGQIYIFGGYQEALKATKKIEVYDDISDSWTILKLRLTYSFKNAVIFQPLESEIIILGGFTKEGVTTSSQNVDLASGVCKVHRNTLLKPRQNALGFSTTNNRLFILGGDSEQTCEQGQNIVNVQGLKRKFHKYTGVYYPNDLTAERPPIPLDSISLQIVEDQQVKNIMVIGEKKMLIIDIENASCEKINLPETLYLYMGGIRMKDKSVMVFGGVSKNMQQISSHTTQIYFREGSVFYQKLSPMNQCRYAFSFVQNDEYLMVTGGRHYGGDDQAILPSAEILCLKPGSRWQELPPMNQRRCSHMSFFFNGKFYVAGGYIGTQQRDDSIEVFDGQRWLMLGNFLKNSIEAPLLFNLSENNSDNINLLIFGGRRQVGGDTDCIESLQIDISKNIDATPFIQNQIELMPNKYCLMKGIRISQEHILVIGSKNKVQVLSFDLKTNKLFKRQVNSKIADLLSEGEFKGEAIGKFLIL